VGEVRHLGGELGRHLTGQNGRCKVQIDVNALTWEKSHKSGVFEDNCVEVGTGPGVRAVRNTKDRDGAVVFFTESEWKAFVDGVRDGQF
jgi:hypothetical protein